LLSGQKRVVRPVRRVELLARIAEQELAEGALACTAAGASVAAERGQHSTAEAELDPERAEPPQGGRLPAQAEQRQGDCQHPLAALQAAGPGLREGCPRLGLELVGAR
jgi:hypothetical protein